MPSVHSAVVCSLATTALLVDGAESHLFGFALILAGIVMYDSFGVRRATGEQAAAINMLIAGLDRNRFKLDQPIRPLREILGHQPREVGVGALLGVLLAVLFNYDHLGTAGTYLQTMPDHSELIGYLAVFAAIILGGWVMRLVLRARYKKSPAIKQLTKRVVTASQTVGWLGLLSVALMYERASYFAWRLWPLLLLGIGLFWGWWLSAESYKTVPAALANEAHEARKRKWLLWGRSKRKAKRT